MVVRRRPSWSLAGFRRGGPEWPCKCSTCETHLLAKSVQMLLLKTSFTRACVLLPLISNLNLACKIGAINGSYCSSSSATTSWSVKSSHIWRSSCRIHRFFFSKYRFDHARAACSSLLPSERMTATFSSCSGVLMIATLATDHNIKFGGCPLGT
jgi:hypothetical protein